MCSKQFLRVEIIKRVDQSILRMIEYLYIEIILNRFIFAVYKMKNLNKLEKKETMIFLKWQERLYGKYRLVEELVGITKKYYY